MKKRFLSIQMPQGQTAVEYLLLFTIVAVVVLTAFHQFFPSFNQSTNNYFDKITTVIRDDVDVEPINGGWCSWGSCGPDGYQRRECACPQPAFGGTFCKPTSEGSFKGSSSVKGIMECEPTTHSCSGSEVYDPLQNKCVTCGNGIPDSGETCVNCPDDLNCEGKTPCMSNAGCNAEEPYCSDIGACVECRTNSDCGEERCVNNTYVKPTCTSDNTCIQRSRATTTGCVPF